MDCPRCQQPYPENAPHCPGCMWPLRVQEAVPSPPGQSDQRQGWSALTVIGLFLVVPVVTIIVLAILAEIWYMIYGQPPSGPPPMP